MQKTKGKESNSAGKKMEKICKEGTLEDALSVYMLQVKFIFR